MRAILTRDLFNENSAKLRITTCSEMLNYIPKIYGFLRDNDIYFRLTATHHKSTITMKGDSLERNLHKIQQYIEERGYER
jgi:hypothetical protein